MGDAHLNYDVIIDFTQFIMNRRHFFTPGKIPVIERAMFFTGF